MVDPGLWVGACRISFHHYSTLALTIILYKSNVLSHALVEELISNELEKSPYPHLEIKKLFSINRSHLGIKIRGSWTMLNVFHIGDT
jgi:hypothetical protein